MRIDPYIEIRVRARSGAMRSSRVAPKDFVSGDGLIPESVAKSRMTMIGAAEVSVSLNGPGGGSPASEVVSALAGVFDSFPTLGGPSPSLSNSVATVLSRRSSLMMMLVYHFSWKYTVKATCSKRCIPGISARGWNCLFGLVPLRLDQRAILTKTFTS